MDPAMATELCTLLANADDVYQLPTAVRRDIHFLRMELEFKLVLLRMISEMPADELDAQVKHWAAIDEQILADSIKEMVNNCRAHILARQLRKADRRGLKGFVTGIEMKLADLRGRHEFATIIKDFKCKIMQMSERRQRYRVDSFVLDSRRPTMTKAEGQQSLPDTEGHGRIHGGTEKLVKIHTDEEAISGQRLKEDAIVGDGNRASAQPRKKYDRVEMELATGVELGNLLADADGVYNLPRWVKRDLRFLEKELESMRAPLQQIAETQANELDEMWAAQLRSLSHEIERVVKNFRSAIRADQLTTSGQGGVKGFASGIKIKLSSLRARREFTTSITELKYLLQEVERRRQWYRIDRTDHVGKHIITESEDQKSLVDTDDLVGIESHREYLVNILTEEAATSSQQLKVVAIVGDGPVGKTTLAKVVYDSLAQQHFDLSAWVTVSSRPDITKILRGMLRQISQEDQHDYIMRLDPKQLIDKIRRTLHDKRYLVIIDNILDEPEWELVKCALPDSKYGSAVLMTSRKVEHIIHYVDKVYNVYKLEPLSEIDSRKLFYRRVFGSEDKCPPDLAAISSEFIQKFDGIPLTIVSIARLLASKTSMKKHEWDAVYASIYSGLLFDQIIGQHDLPSYLKPCLLYLSMFRKGCKVNGEHLVWQWIAEGFVRETEADGKTLQELGEHYLNELVYRKLIEPIDVDAGGRVLSCTVNEMVHDLIISMSTGENFVTILDDQQGISFPNMVNRLSIQGNDIELQIHEGYLSQVRSLVVSGRFNMNSYLSVLRDLCILDLGGCDSLQNDDIKDVGNLLHLQCLIVGGGCITRIPEKIADLTTLETLDLRASGVVELPECVFQVKQLKVLYVNSGTKTPHGIEKLKALQELGDINISSPDLLKELCNLTNLKILRVAIWSWDESYNDPLLKYLGSLVRRRQSIQSLSILTCCSLHFLRDFGHEWAPQSLRKLEIIHSAFFELPKWMGSLQMLSSLSIEVYKLTQDIIDVMGRMSNLCSLSLTSKHAPKGMFNVTGGFEKLTGFQFVSNAMQETFAPGVMKMLTRLRISFQASRTKDICEDFNFGLENLSSLQYVRVDIICFNASRRVVKKAEDAIREAISLGCSRCSDPVIRRVREEDIVDSDDEVGITSSIKGKERVMKKKKSSNIKIRVAAKTFRQKKRKELLQNIGAFLYKSEATV